MFAGSATLGAGSLSSCVSAERQESQSYDKKALDMQVLSSEASVSVEANLPKDKIRKVLVIGSGIAGLSTATELSKKGYQVTVQEASKHLGGKISSRPEEIAGLSQQVEKAQHIWSASSYNLFDILKTVGAFESLKKTNLNVNGKLHTSDLPYPENLTQIASETTDIKDLKKSFSSLSELFFYNQKTNKLKFDHFTAKEWLDTIELDPMFYDQMLKYLNSLALSSEDKLSTAEFIELAHTHITASSHPYSYYVCKDSYQTSIINPWKYFLSKNGVKFKTGVPIKGLKFSNYKCTGPMTAKKEKYDYVVLATDVKGAKQILETSKPVGVKTTKAFKKIKDSVLSIDKSNSYLVLRAWLDVDLTPELQGVTNLIISNNQDSPIKVIFLDQVKETKGPGSSYGSIVEIQLLNAEKYRGRSPEQLWKEVKSKITASIGIENASKKISKSMSVDFSMGTYSDMTSFNTGQSTKKPHVTTALELGISNLIFAGDWVNFDDLPCSLSERSATTAKSAANAICFMDGVEGSKIYGAAPYGAKVIPS